MKNSQSSGDRRFGRPGGWQQASVPDASDASDWFAGRLPDDWFTGTADVQVDREEIVVIDPAVHPAEILSEDGTEYSRGCSNLEGGKGTRKCAHQLNFGELLPTPTTVGGNEIDQRRRAVVHRHRVSRAHQRRELVLEPLHLGSLRDDRSRR